MLKKLLFLWLYNMHQKMKKFSVEILEKVIDVYVLVMYSNCLKVIILPVLTNSTTKVMI